MRYVILGPLEVRDGERTVQLAHGRQRLLLAVLLLSANESISRDRLIDSLWGEAPPPSARRSLSNLVSGLRKALGDGRLVTEGHSYRLTVAEEELDAPRFDALSARGRAALAADEPEQASALLREALSLWRGPALGDLAYEIAVHGEAAGLDERRLATVEDRVEADLALGRHAELVAELDALVTAHPLRERLRCQQMLALYRSGRQADALRTYADGRRQLVEQLGIEPGPALQALERAVLQHDPALGPADALPPPHRSQPPVGRALRHPWRLAGAGAVLLSVAIVGIVLLTGGRGTVAFAENSVGLIDSGGVIREDYAVGRRPGAIAKQGDSLWIADELDGTVTRLSGDRSRATTIDVGPDPTALAVGAGSVWVANGEGHKISQIDPTSNKVVQPIDVGGQPRSLAVGAGAVWVAMPLEGEIARIDLAGSPQPRLAALGGSPAAIVVGGGAVWVADQDAGRVLRIEPRSLVPTKAINVGNGPAAMAVSSGAVWVANRPDGTVSRIDLRTGKVTATTPVGTEAGALAAAGDGVWVADGASASLARLDGAGRVTKRTKTAVSPSALAADGRSVWATGLPGPASHRGGTLRVEALPCAYATTCQDPAFEHASAFDMLTLAYDGLVGYRRTAHGAGNELVGALASDVPEPTDGGRRYVFTLRPGLRYSDGRRVRAADFGASLERTLRLNGAQLGDWYSAIVGAAACLRAPADCDLSRGIVADEASRTITVRLSRADPELPHKLAQPAAALLPGGGPATPIDGAAPPGTGPYRIASIEPGGSARLVRNRYFGGRPEEERPPGFADEIVIHRLEDLEPRLAAVEHGQADIVEFTRGGRQLPQSRVEGLLTAHAGDVSVAPALGVDFMFVNVRTPPFDDVRVRRAVNLATDRTRMVALGGGPAAAEPACQLLPAALPGWSPRCPFTRSPNSLGTWSAPDLPAARRLIAASGTRGMPVRVWTDTTKVRFGRYFANLLHRLGYRTSLRVLPVGPHYYATIDDSRTRAQIGMSGWLADYPTPSTFFDPIFSCRGRIPRSAANQNRSQLCDRPLDRAVQRALRAGGVATAWRPAERRLADLAPAIPLVTRRRIVLASNRTGNVEQHPMWGTLLERAWVR